MNENWYSKWRLRTQTRCELEAELSSKMAYNGAAENNLMQIQVLERESNSRFVSLVCKPLDYAASC